MYNLSSRSLGKIVIFVFVSSGFNSPMGGSHSITLEPEPLTVFRGPRSRGTINIPELASNRVCTNKFSPILFFLGVVILVPCLIYINYYSDLDRIYGYDGCGNVCGKINKKYDKWECTGKNFTKERFLEIKSMDVIGYTSYNYLPRECVSDCSPGFKEVNNLYCLRREIDEYRILGLILSTSGFSVLMKLIVVACVALVLSFMELVLFAMTPYVVTTINAVIIAGVMIYCTSTFGYYGIKDENYIKVVAAVVIGFLALFFIGCLLFFFKKIRLVLALLVEAGQVFLAMPQLLIAVLLETLANTALLVAFLSSISHIMTTGILTESEYPNNELEYKYDALMYFGIVFTCLMFLWAIMICSAMRYMVIGGAVTAWYFARDKSNLQFPLSRNAFIAFRFHLGTVVLGSLIITVISVIRGIVESYMQNRVAKVVVDGVFGIIQTTMNYISKNAYIITAMHGTPFYKSGKRAMKILLKNILDVLAIKVVGESILLMNMLMVIMLTLLTAYMFMGGELYNWSYYVYAFLIALFISSLSYDLLENIVDTLFMCFCEDILLNAGSSETMPETLKKFLRTALPVFKRKEGSESDLNRIRLQSFS